MAFERISREAAPALRIRRLPEGLVNRIAAGEVVERPASAVKELVENAIDAGARKIDVVMREGGHVLISVTDDGYGMAPDDLLLAVERHATSKLPEDDLSHIRTLGFRGEALPSIGSVSRMTIISRTTDADVAWMIGVEGDAVTGPNPSALKWGTRVEIRDLFFATPARLKFLKTPRTEFSHAVDVVKRAAMANPTIAFTLSDGERTRLRLDAAQGELVEARLSRLGAAVGHDFEENALAIEAQREGFRLTGHASLPTMNRRNASYQFLFVNGRPVRDRLLHGAIRGAYSDFIPHDRHAMAALFLEAPEDEVDVNVHPSKTEIRFREPGLVRGLIVGALKHALSAAGHQASRSGSTAALRALGRSVNGLNQTAHGLSDANLAYQAPDTNTILDLATPPRARMAELPIEVNPDGRVTDPGCQTAPPDYPLGAARAQLHATYVVAQTADGIVIVDQHAAHERLVYECMKRELRESGIKRQILLIPEVVELEETSLGRLSERASEFAQLGLILEAFGSGAVVVREVPALIGDGDVQALVRDLAEDLIELDHGQALEDRLSHIAGTIACYSSVRAGRRLNVDEMNALLRNMEATPHSGQCNHGRPTYVELKLVDIERLFGRK